MSTITSDNWTFCQYKNGPLKSFLSLGASPDGEFLYFVTVSDENEKEIFQEEFQCEQKALSFINTRYQAWEFHDAENKSSGSGCDSCSAH